MPTESFVSQVRQHAGDNLVALVALEATPGSPTPTELLVVLRDTSAASLAPLADLIREQHRTSASAILLLRQDEVVRAADVFPLRFVIAQREGRALAGDSPFANLRIEPERLRLRTEQELRNLALRLRLRSLLVADDAFARRRLVRDTLPPLARCLWALLHLGDATPPSSQAKDVFAHCQPLDLDAAILIPLLTADNVDQPGIDRMRALVDRAVEITDRWYDPRDGETETRGPR